ncbi:hypothetical protein OG555_24485 [Kribbella sp. NBC_01484]|uniref:hypothetical protein n=1 Tax=Kribbella sp. NBC_01484 TaxID=2903579 RepID=UPI002E2F8E0C|nr:hypothetical protein [Kribbella sp. NBC_01484]
MAAGAIVARRHAALLADATYENRRDRMKRRGIQLLSLLLATATALIGATTPAAAQYYELNLSAPLWLTAYPTPSLPTACTSTRVTLSARPYEWIARHSTYPESVDHDERFRFITLGAGTYTWTDCLKPSYGVYIHTSTLDPDNPAWQTATVDQIFEMFLWTDSGKIRYGSKLDPV